jgi:CheY-like chemotaxis protein
MLLNRTLIMAIFDVLLVEDSEEDAEIMSEALGSYALAEFRITVRKSLADALKLYQEQKNKPDIVLLDLNLPDSTGLKTFEIARAAIPESTRIIVVTGLQDKELIVQSLIQGATNFVVKSADQFIRRATQAVSSLNRVETPAAGFTLYISSRKAREMAPALRTLRELVEENPFLNISVVDVESHPQISAMAKIITTPTLVMERPSGREVFVGDLSEPYRKKQILEWIEELVPARH